MADMLKPFDPEKEFKCSLCGTRNPKGIAKCRSCEQPAPDAAPVAAKPPAGAITSKGFVLPTTAGTSGGFTMGGTGGGFTFGTSTTSSSAPTTGGFVFQPTASFSMQSTTTTTTTTTEAKNDDVDAKSDDKKDDAVVEKATTKKKNEKDNNKDDDEEEQEEEPVKEAPKKRGRQPAAAKAKAKANTMNDDDEQQEKADDNKDDEVEEEEKPKPRGRGRKAAPKAEEDAEVVAPKRSARAAAAAKKAEKQAVEEEEEQKPKPRGRAAAKKAAMKDQDDDEEDAEEQEEEEKPKRSVRQRVVKKTAEQKEADEKAEKANAKKTAAAAKKTAPAPATKRGRAAVTPAKKAAPAKKTTARGKAKQQEEEDEDDEDEDNEQEDDEDDEQEEDDDEDDIKKPSKKAKRVTVSQKVTTKDVPARSVRKVKKFKSEFEESSEEESDDEEEDKVWLAKMRAKRSEMKSADDLAYVQLTVKDAAVPVARPTPHNNGKALTFGTGDMAQLGLGVNTRERKFPAVVDALSEYNIIAVAAGALHNLALTSQGEVFSWGCNDDGALGRRTKLDTEEFTPGLVRGLEHVNVIAIACGASHSVALTDKGTVYAWGSYRDMGGLMGFDEENLKCYAAVEMEGDLKGKFITRIAAGESHCLALSKKGEVFYWGDIVYNGRPLRNKYMKLVPRLMNMSLTPAELKNLYPKLAQRGVKGKKNGGLKPEDTNIVHIFAGGYTCCAVAESGLLWTWGPNNYTQTAIPRDFLADGKPIDKDEAPTIYTPHPVPYFLEKDIKIIGGACSTQFSLFLTDDRRVFAVGRHAEGRIGQAKDYQYPDPQEQATPLEIKELSQQFLSSATSWTPQVESKTPLHGLFDSPNGKPDCIVALSCGEAHSVVTTAQGRVLSWGSGDTLQLGTGIDETQYGPYWIRSQQITTIPRFVLHAACGSQHSILLCKDAEATQ